jgi:hypothetical protein
MLQKLIFYNEYLHTLALKLFPTILPGKRGVLPSNSAKMHPTDQISTALVYSEAFRITSGARYQRVTTYLNMYFF